MQDQTPHQTTRQKFSRLFLWVSGLIFLIGVVGVVYLLITSIQSNRVDRWGLALPMILLATISLLGLYLIQQILRSAMHLTDRLDHLQTATLSSTPTANDSSTADRIGILEKINQAAARFDKKTHELDNLIGQIQVLTETNEMTSRLIEMKELLTLVLHKAMLGTHARKGTVMLKREQNEGLEVLATEGWVPNLTGPIDCNDTLAGRVIETGQPLLAQDIEHSLQDGRPNNDQSYASPSFLIMPISSPSEVIGALCLSEKGNSAQFSLQDQQFLTVLLDQVGTTIGNARLIQGSREKIRSLEDRVALQEIRLHQARHMLFRADRLSVLGQLVAGVAHEINNPLTTVLGFSQLLLEKQQSDGIGKKELGKIFDESNRAAGIVRNLLMFAHEQRPGPMAIDLNELIHHVINLREYDLRMKNIDISTDMDASIPPVLLDPGRIQHVLLNLISNSAEAMVQDKERKIRLGTSCKNNQITIWITDTGKGIPADLQQSVFEPFITSHSNQRHSGLGLSLSREIIEDHGGTIQLVSVEGQGTRVTIDLPLVLAPAPVQDPLCELNHSEPQRFDNRFALSIDDETDNAELVALILEEMGFHVEVMTESPAALRRLAQESFDLVVCNIRMPEIDGRQLYRELRKLRPRSFPRMIFTSGDATDPGARLFAENNHLRLLPKPFVSEELTQAVQAEFTKRPLYNHVSSA